MNIFVLDEDPVKAAHYHCDKHVVKMILETAQILCTVHHKAGTPNVPYRATHKQHPCTVWASESMHNYMWLLKLGEALCEEYRLRYGKQHKTRAVLQWCRDHTSCIHWPEKQKTAFAQAMPEKYRQEDPVKAYREYYQGEKAHFATWRPPSNPPAWWF